MGATYLTIPPHTALPLAAWRPDRGFEFIPEAGAPEYVAVGDAQSAGTASIESGTVYLATGGAQSGGTADTQFAATFAHAATGGASGVLHLANLDGVEFAAGVIDEVAIYDHLLGPARVAAQYNAGIGA